MDDGSAMSRTYGTVSAVARPHRVASVGGQRYACGFVGKSPWAQSRL